MSPLTPRRFPTSAARSSKPERCRRRRTFRRASIIILTTPLLLMLSSESIGNAANPSFGAIAYSTSRHTIGTALEESGDSAVLAAVNACRQQGGWVDCVGYLWFQNGYGALARSGDSFGTGWGTNAGNADEYAVQICQQHQGTNCQVVPASRIHTPGIAAESPSATGGVVPAPVPTPGQPIEPGGSPGSNGDAKQAVEAFQQAVQYTNTACEVAHCKWIPANISKAITLLGNIKDIVDLAAVDVWLVKLGNDVKVFRHEYPTATSPRTPKAREELSKVRDDIMHVREIFVGLAPPLALVWKEPPPITSNGGGAW